MDISCLLTRHALGRGDHLAFVCDDMRLTWRELNSRVCQVANALLDIGIRKGDKIAIHHGAFIGYEGVFDIQLSGTDRARVLLSLMDNRFVPVELHTNYIHLIN